MRQWNLFLINRISLFYLAEESYVVNRPLFQFLTLCSVSKIFIVKVESCLELLRFSRVFATQILREQCHLAAHHAVKFREATILSSNVIKSHTLHSKPVLNFDPFCKNCWKDPRPRWECGSKILSFSRNLS